MTEEKKEKLNKLMQKIRLVNAVRLMTLFIGVILLLFLYFGPRFFDGASWFMTAKVNVFHFMEWDVILLVIVTFVKVGFSIRYNSVLKKQ